VIAELRVRDLATIADVTLPLGPGLNVLTGETGAGKSMLVDALALLLGERADSAMVRPGRARRGLRVPSSSWAGKFFPVSRRSGSMPKRATSWCGAKSPRRAARAPG